MKNWILLSIFVLFSGSALADEGMWTFNNLPLEQINTKYGFKPDQKWLDHVRLSSVRFMDGGSGSFVSPDGLVMTNHHVAVFQIQKLSTPENDLVKNGFYAKTYEEELPTKDLELNVLVDMRNVTERVTNAAKTAADDAEALKLRQKEIAAIEKEAQEQSKLKAEVVGLYHGGEYWLYLYKKYTDVRLVFAPERQAAYFGGDLDNFTYPRWDLDVTFLRVYEDGKPIKSPDYLKWNKKGAEPGELVFISGHPGSTDRLYTHAQLIYMRDYHYPLYMESIEDRLAVLKGYAQMGEEQARQALVLEFALKNSEKAIGGIIEGLNDEQLIAKHKAEEEDFKNRVMSNPELKTKYGDTWNNIESLVQKSIKGLNQRMYRNMSNDLFGKALSIVRYHLEQNKKDADRLEGYHDSQLESLKFRILSKAPVYKDLEEKLLASGLKRSQEKLGNDDEFIKVVFGAEPSASAIAEKLIKGTKLEDPEYRKKLLEGKKKDIIKSDDPLIQLALKLDPMFREINETYKEEIQGALAKENEKIANARFAVYGNEIYPDATFTLRLTYGNVQGFPINGTMAPPYNTVYGLYDRALSFGNEGDFELPTRFWLNKENVDLNTKCNFVSTCDIIGGNSGSPTINKNAEVVGIVFDGNIQSLPGRFIYDGRYNRAVSLHTAYIIEALRKVYNADKLANELENNIN